MVSDLKQAGFVLNVLKSCLDPVQIGKWLGFIIDLRNGNFYIPEQKMESLKSAIKDAYPFTRVSVKQRALSDESYQ